LLTFNCLCYYDLYFGYGLRKSGIIREVEEGAVFFFVKENKKVVGYIEYIKRENKKLTIFWINTNYFLYWIRAKKQASQMCNSL
jgi:hypothetical protein